MSDSNYKHVYKFDVTMTCGGCSGAVTRVLKKQNLRNLSDPEDTQKAAGDFKVDLEAKTAEVYALEYTDEATKEPTSLSFEKVLKTIQGTGKKVNSAEADGVAQPV